MSYSDSLRQQAKWIDEAVAGRGDGFDLGDIDTDEFRAAADELDRLTAELSGQHKPKT